MELTTQNYLISVYDIDNYINISKNLSTPDLFKLMSQIQTMVIETLQKNNPVMIKNLGDSNLMIFNSDDMEQKLESLKTLKTRIEDFLLKNGFPHKVSFSSHFGEITVGSAGIEPFIQTEAFGDEVNHTFFLLGKASKGEFAVSQKLLDAMGVESRKNQIKQ